MLSTWIRSLTGSRRITVPIHIPARKSGIASRPIESLLSTIGELEHLLVPLAIRPDLAVRPTVQPGDRVTAFSALGRPDGDSGATPNVGVPAFSPAEAVVEGLVRVDTQHAADLPAVRLRLVTGGIGHSNTARHFLATAPAETQMQTTSVEDARQALADLARIEDLPATLDDSGVVTWHGGRPEPLGTLLRRAVAAQANLLVVSAIQSEPRLSSHGRLVHDATGVLASGIRAISHYLSLRRATLLVSASQDVPLTAIRQFRRHGVRVLPLRTSFPGDSEPIVLKRLFTRSITPGHSGLDSRCLLLPADAAWQAGVALLHRRPAVFRPITVAGDCLDARRQGVFLVPVGLTILGLMRWLGRRGMLLAQPQTVTLGGPMTGSAVTDPARTVIDATTQGVLLMNRQERLETIACIRCGWCVYGCPVAIDPIAILDMLEADRPHALAGLVPQRCIDCGVCSYVCPAHLPLAQAVRTARTLLQSNSQ